MFWIVYLKYPLLLCDVYTIEEFSDIFVVHRGGLLDQSSCKKDMQISSFACILNNIVDANDLIYTTNSYLKHNTLLHPTTQKHIASVKTIFKSTMSHIENKNAH